jgi:hypothetical protein
MSENRKRLPPPSGAHLPVASPAASPTATLPALPASSGKIWGSRTTIMRADARFVQAHSEYLQARTEQTQQMKALLDARIGLALKIAELATLPELVEHEYQRGRRDRLHDNAMQRLTHETAEVNARINLARAQQHLASFEPQPEPPVSPPDVVGLTPDDVDELLAALPDIADETKKTISYLLHGRLKEKKT